MRHPVAIDRPARSGGESDPLVGRLANLLSGVDLDCACRAKLDDALARFADLERIRERRQLLSDARQQVARINALLDFLKELDDLGLNEADRTVFDEVAQLFEDVAAAARQGAADARQLG
jgi:hypothetical protein